MNADVVFVGHVCFDEIVPHEGTPYVRPGSAVLCGAAVAARLGARAAVVTRMNPADEALRVALDGLGLPVFAVTSAQSTYVRVIHPSADPDDRRLEAPRDAGFFQPADVPADLQARVLHLAGVTDREFSLDFMRALRDRGFRLSVDMQSFVRAVGPDRAIRFSDVPDKKDIVALAETVKLDVVEAEHLTGTRDLGRVAQIIAGWGAREVLITASEGAALWADNRLRTACFTNRSQTGRTGRGDTTISAYLCRRRTHSPDEALKFAAALVSIKLETPGPFAGTLEDVERRMRQMK